MSFLSSRLLFSKIQLNRTAPLATLPQVRTQWYQDEVRSIRDPITGKWRYEQPRQAIQRFRVMRTSKLIYECGEMILCVLLVERAPAT